LLDSAQGQKTYSISNLHKNAADVEQMQMRLL
jgi:hypothetical protein